MGAKIGQDDEAIAEINIVPFVDIILVVLIIFMVTAPFIVKNNIKVKLPKAQSGEQQKKPASFSITIQENGDVYLNNNKVTLENLAIQANKASSQSKKTQAVIAADENISHGKVVKIIDTIKKNGITQFAITVKAEK